MPAPLQTSHPAAQTGRILPGALLLCVAGVYGASLTSFPGPSGDNAEFQCLAKVLGSPHPTGYPLYLLLAHIFQLLLPIGTLAWKINLFSTLGALIALAALYEIGRELQFSRASLCCSLGWLATTPAWWRLGTVAEVYSLHAALGFSALALVLRWARTSHAPLLLSAIGLHALSYGNHLSSLFFLPPLLIAARHGEWRSMLNRRTFAWLALSLSCCALLYAFVIFRSRVSEASYLPIPNVRVFWDYVTGAQFRSEMGFHDSGSRGPWQGAVRLTRLLGQEWGWMCLVGAAGLWLARRRGGPRLDSLLLLALLQGVLLWSYGIPDISDYFMPLGGILALGLAGFISTFPHQGFGRWMRAFVLVAALPLAVSTLRRTWETGLSIRYRAGAEQASQIREALLAVDNNAVMYFPNWKQYKIGCYYIWGEGIAHGLVNPRQWLTYGPASDRQHLKTLLKNKGEVLIYCEAGQAACDLRTSLFSLGAVLDIKAPHVWKVTGLR